MPTFDTSALIDAWEFYPPDQFPRLWKWMGERVESQDFTAPAAAMKELKGKHEECASWMMKNNVYRLQTDNTVLVEAARIKSRLGIVEDDYGTGVNETDLLIIAAARIHKLELITQESWQHNAPGKMKNFQIPRVCVLDDVAVKYRNLIQLIRASKQVF